MNQLEEPDATRLERAWQQMQEKNYQSAIAEAESVLETEDEDLKTEARRLTAMAHFQLQNYKLASAFFQQVSQTSGAPNDFFNLATTSALAGEISRSRIAYFSALQSAQHDAEEDHLPPPFMMFYYMQALRDAEAWENAFLVLGHLSAFYRELHVTDDDFLYSRGVPLLAHSLQAASDILRNVERSEAEAWYANMEAEVDEEGQEKIQSSKKEVLGLP